jgi:hypothetical protein
VQHGVDVLLEDGAGVRRSEQPAAPAQQRRADLLLQPGQGPRDSRLAHAVDVGHLGHGDAVRDLLEPAQRLGVHTHDVTAWICVHIYIGRMD